MITLKFLDRFSDNRSALSTMLLNIMSGTALVAAASWFSYNAFAVRSADLPARVVNTMRIIPQDMEPGGQFTILTNNTYYKLCPWEAQWSLTRPDGVQVLKVIDPIRQPTGPLGTRDGMPLIRTLPPETAPGKYVYGSEVVDICPDGKSYTSVRKKIDITVHPHGEALAPTERTVP